MAQLHNYYVLCPLIDQKSFLGISEDKDCENVLVTLGRNVVNKYRLSDQKQIAGWTSKDHITSDVVFSSEHDSYIGVFNNNTIKMWQEDTDNLDKAKKYKFSANILRVIRKSTTLLIIFTNGTCASLAHALENRKKYDNKTFIKENKTIVGAACYNLNNIDHICYVLKSDNSYELLTCPLREEIGDMDKSKLNKIRIYRSDNVKVAGHLIVPNKGTVYFLWSDSKLTVYNLFNQTWKTIGGVPWISTENGVSMAWMGKNHVIIFGSNMEQDGAIIVAYNTSLGVGSCRYPMKMYSQYAKLYCLNRRILLESSNHIGMLPYVLETKRNLSSLLGTHELTDERMQVADWGTQRKALPKVSKEIQELINLGLTERNICSQVIPPLIEKEDYKQVFEVIKDINDIPEPILVLLLNFVVKLVNPDNTDVTESNAFDKLLSVNDEEPSIEVTELRSRFQLLNYLLQVSFSDALFIPYLRSSLSLDNALFIISYIAYILESKIVDIKSAHINVKAINDSKFESKLFDWCTLLMDAFYQQYLLTKDAKVTNALDNLMKVVDNLINHLLDVDKTMSKLNNMLNGRPKENNQNNLTYTIELMKI